VVSDKIDTTNCVYSTVLPEHWIAYNNKMYVTKANGSSDTYYNYSYTKEQDVTTTSIGYASTAYSDRLSIDVSGYANLVYHPQSVSVTYPVYTGAIYNVGYDVGTASNLYTWAPMSKADQFRAQMRQNLKPQIMVKDRLVDVECAKNAKLMQMNGDKAELRARLLLRDMIGEKDFRRYMTRGFIICKGRSGMMYKITGGYDKIVSYVLQAGKWVEQEMLCIIVHEKMPFTDWVIWRKLMCEGDEFALRKIAVITKLGSSTYIAAPAMAVA
jgi:hypothetical protein